MAATIRDFELPELRMQAQEIGPVTVVLDAYNANPTSMRHALDVFDRWPAKARRILVLGEMKELGEASARCHETLGSDVASRKFDILFTVGPGAACLHRAVHQNGIAGSRLFHCETTGEAARELASCVRQGDTLFLKGSRALALEQITQSLRERYEKETALE
jgi:UDP-N-acetylmuramoyl-tripeptide--D-alanyl-D-alanine ligase